MDGLTGLECRQVQAVPVLPHTRARIEKIWTTLHLPTCWTSAPSSPREVSARRFARKSLSGFATPTSKPNRIKGLRRKFGRSQGTYAAHQLASAIAVHP